MSSLHLLAGRRRRCHKLARIGGLCRSPNGDPFVSVLGAVQDAEDGSVYTAILLVTRSVSPGDVCMLTMTFSPQKLPHACQAIATGKRLILYSRCH